MKRHRFRIRASRRDGCGFLLLTCFFSCLFLILNAALVAKLYPLTLQQMPPLANHPRLEQLFLFLMPVLLLFCEWWLVDRIVEAFAPRHRDREHGS